ncbi:MAG: putative molybdenum carrier protein [Verrucomicrobiota bacterium]
MLKKVVSGGQTGADRAALKWALSAGIECGGWCPAGRHSEDGDIDGKYPLIETPSADYAQRTEWNVRDSDATLLVSRSSKIVGGTALTKTFASRWNRPCLHIHEGSREASERLICFIDENRVETLNVAGPRRTTESGIEDFLTQFLENTLNPSSRANRAMD